MKIVFASEKIKDTISMYIDGGTLFSASRSTPSTIEINASHFKIKRQSSEISTQNSLFPFGNCENMDPASKNLGRGESFVGDSGR